MWEMRKTVYLEMSQQKAYRGLRVTGCLSQQPKPTAETRTGRSSARETTANQGPSGSRAETLKKPKRHPRTWEDVGMLSQVGCLNARGEL